MRRSIEERLPRVGFLSGVASIFDLFGTMPIRNPYEGMDPQEADAEAFRFDAEALRSDWQG